jgi:hypothetical protein
LRCNPWTVGGDVEAVCPGATRWWIDALILKPIFRADFPGNMKRTLKRGLKVLEIAELEAKDV